MLKSFQASGEIVLGRIDEFSFVPLLELFLMDALPES
jgi:hypothetical protein